MDLKNYSYLILTFVLCLVVQICFSSSEYEEKFEQSQKFNLSNAEPNIFTSKYFGFPSKDIEPIEISKRNRVITSRGLFFYIPDSFDARDQWPDCTTIGSIKDQSNCASCWAVSVAAAFSDRLCVSTDGRVNEHMSANYLISCCEECTDYDSTSSCESGGHPEIAWEYIQESGIPTGGDYNSNEGCQPYEIKPSDDEIMAPTPKCHIDSCTNPDYDGSFEESVRYGKSHYELISNDDAQSDIYTYGPIITSFDVYDDFHQYESGVYSHSWGDFGEAHAVRVIGWGHDEESDLDYWLVANSYGTEWGDGGLFKIRRGNNECEFEKYFYAGLPDDTS